MSFRPSLRLLARHVPPPPKPPVVPLRSVNPLKPTVKPPPKPALKPLKVPVPAPKPSLAKPKIPQVPYKPPRKWEQYFTAWLLSMPKSIYWAVMTVMGMVCIRDYFFSLDWVNGSSMAPSLSPDAHETGEQDLVLISRARPQQGLKRGDVITFWKPHKPEEISVKRVIALQGDTVYPHRGYALEKDTGKRLALMDGLPEVDEESGDREVGKVVVPYNHVWVEGDNWRMTYDSNDIGPVSMSLIDGKVLRVWRNWWFRPLQDKRKEIKTKVVESAEQMEMPALFA